MQLFIDVDGVVANLDDRFREISGYWPKEYEEKFGNGTFWDVVNSVDEFFYNLDPIHDAHELYESVKHLNPIFLTGGHDGETFHHTKEQKERWIEKHFPGAKVIVTTSKKKREHMKPGDIIIDDWEKYRHLWEEAGGHWILHKSAKQSLDELQTLLERKQEVVHQ